MANHKHKYINIDNNIPSIIIPNDKLNILIDWYNKDIRYLKEVPKVFDECYIYIHCDLFSSMNYSKIIKSLAKSLKTTYRVMEDMYNKFIDDLSNMGCYVKFNTESDISFTIFNNRNEIFSKINVQIGDSGNIPDPISNDMFGSDFDYSKVIDSATHETYIQDKYNYFIMCICISCLWYIATTTKTTKYVYKDKYIPKDANTDKKIINVKDYKYITTPIYELKNMKIKTVDKLISRRKGWTYSHSFQVHGHYRHYKNGKTVFINSYIKGNNKPYKNQKIIIEPKEIKI